MEKYLFGRLENEGEVWVYPLISDTAKVEIMTRGATIKSFTVDGVDVVGGFDTLEDYLFDDSHQGATIGRVANRVAKARFNMDGVEYKITENDNGNCLHGGWGFDMHNFTVKEYDATSVTMSYTSKDGEEGFPNEVSLDVKFTLIGGALIIDYTATPSGKTPISLTNHAYFNLDGFGGTVKEHIATIYADRYTEVDATLIPNGNRPSVTGTVFDFNTPEKIGARVGGDFVGYDHNYMLKTQKCDSFLDKELPLAAEVTNGSLTLSVYTDQPCIQFYIGNFLGKKPDFKGGVKQVKHGAFCLEAQTEPNSINNGVGFYDKGEVYTQRTVYKVERVK